MRIMPSVRPSLRLGFAAGMLLALSALPSRPATAQTGGMALPEKSRIECFRSIIAPGTKPKLLHDGGARTPGLTFTEGPAWMNGRLYFSNYYMFWKKFGSIPQGGPMVMEPDGSFRILNTAMQTCGMKPLGNGNLAVCDLIGSRVIEMSPEGRTVRVLADSWEGIGLDGPNDLVIDAKGGIYFSEPRSSRKKKKTLPGTAVLYRNPQGKVILVTGWNEFVFPNGCALSPDGKTLYLDDSGSSTVWAFEVSPDGTLGGKRPFAELVQKVGKPGHEKGSNADGMTVDTLGNIYVTAFGCIEVFDSSGSFLGVIEFPEAPSNCIFGGKDMKTLFATCRDRIYSIETRVTGMAYPVR
jgi:gluconolactonase